MAALLSTAAACLGSEPEAVADLVGNAGAGRLKQVTTEAVNDFLAPHRRRRAELAADPGLVRDVLRAGNRRANEIADATLTEVRAAMGTLY